MNEKMRGGDSNWLKLLVSFLASSFLIFFQRFAFRQATFGAFGLVSITLAPLGRAQIQNPPNAEPDSSVVSKSIGHLFNYLNMAGTTKASDFEP
jgi:hypothetical protein